MKKINLSDRELIAFCGKQQSQYIISPTDCAPIVKSMVNGTHANSEGDSMPWAKTREQFQFRKGEVTVWGGINGHGKSQIINQVCAHGLKNRKWLIASMEMLPEQTMYRMARQVSGVHDVSERFVDRFLKWTDDRLWIYDQTDSVRSESMLGLVHYAATELGIEHIVIDSLMKCGVGRDRYELQADFVDRICWAAKTHKIHIHLVHHIRKGDDESRIPNKFDLRGAAEISDMVDNVIICWRNKPKEDRQRKGKSKETDDTVPDQILKVDKQRNGEWEGSIALWFHAKSLQYTPTAKNEAIPYWDAV